MKICRPKIEDFEEIKNLFSETLTDNFHQEGVFYSHQEDLKEEILAKIEALKRDFSSNGKLEYFLVARLEGKIVGTIAYGTPGSLIIDHIDERVLEAPEMKSVYILPAFQGKGIGSLLVAEMQERLLERGIMAFYLDCGYKRAQKYWHKKLGPPIRVLNDFWKEGSHHMIWYKRLDNLKRFDTLKKGK